MRAFQSIIYISDRKLYREHLTRKQVPPSLFELRPAGGSVLNGQTAGWRWLENAEETVWVYRTTCKISCHGIRIIRYIKLVPIPQVEIRTCVI